MKKIVLFLGFVVIAFLPAVAGRFFTPGEWYYELQKPTWTPPSWVFGPVWTFLYFLMAISGYLAWSGSSGRRSVPFVVYGIQLFLNALWSVIFFGLHSPGLAFGDLVVLWFAILGNVVLFWRINRASGYLLIPYFLWTSFAGMLNLAIWKLNA
ncbi:MAG: hypothetical protein AMS15_04680 [Planctomycetes bacterium DG_23]|nr:MAG: hypothetical protein AMS15_04680 [Planctomycetes bacterium DG_23]